MPRAAALSLALALIGCGAPTSDPCLVDSASLIPRISGDCSGVDLTGVDLDGADIGGVTWGDTTCPDGTNSDHNGGTCAGHLSPPSPPAEPEPSPEPAEPEPEPIPEPEGPACDDPNLCGGCSALAANPGDPCGVCEDGLLTCAGPDEVICQGDSPDNGCGGCTPLPIPPDQPCGVCRLDRTVCAGKSDTACNGDTPCPLEFIAVEPGEFRMGSPPDELGRFTMETLHRVRVTRPFEIKKTEVTQAEWTLFMGSNPSFFLGCDDCPVERVSWYDALHFLNRLSERLGLPACYALDGCQGTPGGGCDGQSCLGDFQCSQIAFAGVECLGFRLPTEAEWEYAARAGTTDATYNGYVFRDGCTAVDLNTDPIAWYCPNSADTTHPVAAKIPNPWGIFDVSGNAYEWVWDLYSPDYYGASPLNDPTGPLAGEGRVARGGAYNSRVTSVRSASRNFFNPLNRSPVISLRPARTLP